MLLCFALGSMVAFLHHSFYQFLDGRSAEGGIFPNLQKYPEVNDQSIVNLLGNFTTKVASGFLIGAVSIAYSQVFWWKLRTHRMTVKRVDELQEFSEKPWNPLTWPSAYALRLVAVVALCKVAMDQVSSITPGAITIKSASLHTICAVDNVDFTLADLGGNFDLEQQDSDANGRTRSFTTRVIVGGAVLPPKSRCGACSYELDFIAPAVQCHNITQAALAEIDSSEASANLALPVTSESIRVWAGEYDWPNLTQMRVSSRNIAGISPQTLLPVDQLPVIALNCTAWQATYHAIVNHSAPASVVATNVTIHNQLLLSAAAENNAIGDITPQLRALWSAFSYLLTGSVNYSMATNTPHGDYTDMAISWSPIVDGSSANGIAWSWAGDLQTLIPELMTNVSLSLLSGELSDVRNPTLTPTVAMCTRPGVVFVYSPLRLIVTYAVAAFLAILCMSYGFYASRFNGRGETLDFSRILGAATPPLTPDTAIDVTPSGRVVARELDESP